MTLRIPIGWQRVVVHRGVIVTGSFSIRSLTISNGCYNMMVCGAELGD